MQPLLPLVAAIALLVCPGAFGQGALRLPLDRVKLPPGFEIAIFADNVKDARSLALGDKGTVFVGTRKAGKVYAIPNDGKKASRVITIASGLDMPNGVAVRDGALYVAEAGKVSRYDAIEANLRRPPRPQLVYDGYPDDRPHGWKHARFGPDGWLYVPVGAPCNVCDRDAPYATITRLKPDGSAMEVFARGVRNSVGLDWHPESRELWFTDNGRDLMGDNVPPDELNHAPRPDMHFGFPYCHAGDVADPEHGAKHHCAEFSAPAKKLDAHVAALGIRFYTGTLFPTIYRHRLFVAEHGSWNRSRKSGYRIMQATIEDGKVTDYSVFAEGFLDPKRDRAWGRPVDLLVMPDGALLVSDDHANVIYRISFNKVMAVAPDAPPRVPAPR